MDNQLVVLATAAADAGKYYVQAVNEKNGENKTSPSIHLNVAGRQRTRAVCRMPSPPPAALEKSPTLLSTANALLSPRFCSLVFYASIPGEFLGCVFESVTQG